MKTQLTPKEVAERAFAAAERGDFDEYLGYYADDASWELPSADFFPEGRRWEGKESLLHDFLRGTYAAYYDLDNTRLKVTSVHGGEDHAVVEFTLTGKTTKGRDYRNNYLVFLKITDGLVRSGYEWTNSEYQKRLLID
jgi:hypothetical protein